MHPQPRERRHEPPGQHIGCEQVSCSRASASRPPAATRSASADLIGRRQCGAGLSCTWHPKFGLLESYELESARAGADLFPLAISPECQLLACRSDTGRGVRPWKRGGSVRAAV